MVIPKKKVGRSLVDPTISPSALRALKTQDLTSLKKLPISTLLKLSRRPNFPTELGIQPVNFVDGFSLLPHQESALEWMTSIEKSDPQEGMRGGVLSLEKGLGKTITALTLALSTPREENSFPTLVICKKMYLWDTWKNEIESKFDPVPKVIYLHKDHMTPTQMDNLTLAKLRGADLVVTSYEVCTKLMKNFPEYETQLKRVLEEEVRYGGKSAIHLRTKGQLNPRGKKGPRLIYEVEWSRVVCDESQNFVTDTSKIFKSVMGIVSDRRWCLSGSMVRNYDTDILSQLRFLGYNTITSNAEWKKIGRGCFENRGLGKRIFQMGYIDAGVVMPDKEEEIVPVSLTGKHREVYDLILGKLRESHRHSLKFCQLSLLTRIRQALVAPYLLSEKAKKEKFSRRGLTFRKKEPEGENEVITNLGSHLEKLIPADLLRWCSSKEQAGWKSPKIAKALEIIDLVVGEGRKVIVFSTQVTALDLLASKLDLDGVDYRLIDGSVSTRLRTEYLDDFRSSDSDAPNVLLASYKVCSESLNISEASCAILLDLWWNNATRDQAVARLWRMGQKRTVQVFSLFANNSLDARIEEICNNKELISAKYKSGSKSVKSSPVIERLLK